MIEAAEGRRGGDGRARQGDQEPRLEAARSVIDGPELNENFARAAQNIEGLDVLPIGGGQCLTTPPQADTLVLTRLAWSAGGAAEMSAKPQHYDVIPQTGDHRRRPPWPPGERRCLRSGDGPRTSRRSMDAVEALFGVEVKAVNTTITKGKLVATARDGRVAEKKPIRDPQARNPIA